MDSFPLVYSGLVSCVLDYDLKFSGGEQLLPSQIPRNLIVFRAKEEIGLFGASAFLFPFFEIEFYGFGGLITGESVVWDSAFAGIRYDFLHL